MSRPKGEKAKKQACLPRCESVFSAKKERDTMQDNSVAIFGGNKHDNLKKAIEEIKKNLPAQLELMALWSTLHKAKYDALIKEGFTEPKALELCKILS